MYRKPWLSYREQLQKLKSRGLAVTDEPKALEYLERIGYYRLSGYWYPFRERSGLFCPVGKGIRKGKKIKATSTVLDTFKPGSSFEAAVHLYVFDKKLRLLVLDALERIEVALRVDIAHTLGKYDPFAYLNPDLLFEGFAKDTDSTTGLPRHVDWMKKQATQIARSKEDFIKHNKNKYGHPLPIWIACEVWDFNTLSELYDGMRLDDQDAIASKYGVGNGRILASWLRSLNYLRNVCAHHSRLWNRNIIDQPKKPPEGVVPDFDNAWEPGNEHIPARPFLLLCICQKLLSAINPSSSWWQRFSDLLEEFPENETLGIGWGAFGVAGEWRDWECFAKNGQ
ncbi:abortive infection bacteriophage resistance protein [Marinobacter pelagius]|uniref:Abortive infection bacteriophage resistance protein n=1 Tax=Marinobacter pelagius TaxID=379482 RepID=A0A366GXW9_9GAMM|nr:Abi family protein [Marinobacter pelagius]RBP33481.1 abortive infection bacteriophage resistance protein [Marinobacter pelagius]